MAWQSTLEIRSGFIWRRGRERQACMEMAEEYSSRKMAARAGDRFWIVIATFMTSPLIRVILQFFMLQVSNLRLGARWIVESTGRGLQGSISNGDTGSFLIRLT